MEQERRYLVSAILFKEDEELRISNELHGIVNSLEPDYLKDIIDEYASSERITYDYYLFKFWRELDEDEEFNFDIYPFESLKDYQDKKKDNSRYVIGITYNAADDDDKDCLIKEDLMEVASLDYDAIRYLVKLEYPEIQGGYYIKVIKELQDGESIDMFENYHWISDNDRFKVIDYKGVN